MTTLSPKAETEIVSRIDNLVEEMEKEGLPFDLIASVMDDYTEMMFYHQNQE